MPDIAQQLRRMVADQIRAEAAQHAEHVVSAVNGDGTVTLGYDEAAIPNVSCMSSYPVRAIGDKVVVAKLGAGSWYVIGKAESNGSDGTITVRDLYDAIDNLHTQLLNEIPASISLQFGTGSGMPSGFDDAASVGVRDDGSGNFTLYLGGVAGSPSQRPTASTAPAPRVIGPSGYGSWAGNGDVDATQVQQGGQSQWTGAWFYGNAIALASQGKTVKAMTVNLQRFDSGGAAPVRAYLHDGSLANAQPNLLDGPTTPFSLAAGEKRAWSLPASWRVALADPNNAAKGVAVFSGTQSEYIAFTTDSGSLTVTFAAS